MRFRSTLPPNFRSKEQLDRTEYYMQLSDSDDEDKPEITARQSATTPFSKPSTSKGGKKGSAGDKKAIVRFKRDKPVNRERPESATQFRTVASNDAEMKVSDIGCEYNFECCKYLTLKPRNYELLK